MHKIIEVKTKSPLLKVTTTVSVIVLIAAGIIGIMYLGITTGTNNTQQEKSAAACVTPDGTLFGSLCQPGSIDCCSGTYCFTVPSFPYGVCAASASTPIPAKPATCNPACTSLSACSIDGNQHQYCVDSGCNITLKTQPCATPTPTPTTGYWYLTNNCSVSCGSGHFIYACYGVSCDASKLPTDIVPCSGPPCSTSPSPCLLQSDVFAKCDQSVTVDKNCSLTTDDCSCTKVVNYTSYKFNFSKKCFIASTPPRPTSVLLDPFGDWTMGQSKTITWDVNSFNNNGVLSNVDLWLCPNNGSIAGCHQFASSLNIADSGSFKASLPAGITPGSGYGVFVRQAGNNNYSGNGWTDYTFSVLPPAVISLPAGDWIIGTSKTITWNTTAFTSNLDMWLCAGTTINANCFLELAQAVPNSGSASPILSFNSNSLYVTSGGNYFVSLVKHNAVSDGATGSFSGERVKLVPPPAPTYPCLPYSDVLKGCGRTTGITADKNCSKSTDECYCDTTASRVYFSRSCFISSTPPSVSNVQITGMYSTIQSTLTWLGGDTRRITFDYDYFGTVKIGSITANVASVAVYLCNPIGSNLESFVAQDKCVLAGTIDNWQNKVPISGTPKGSSGVDQLLGRNVLGTLQKQPTSTFALAFDHNRTMFKICPSITTVPGASQPGSDPLVGTVPKGAICAVSPVFTVISGSSDSYGLSAGQGCVIGECVCVNGKAARCGSPMDLVGKGCQKTDWCAAGPSN